MHLVTALGSVVLIGVLAGCGELFDDTASATWVVSPNQDLGSDTSTFAVLVTRVGCNGGLTGEVTPPDLSLDETQVVLTFRVRPDEPESATCPGNDAVPYEVALGEPLGDRKLVDGFCLLAHGSLPDCEPDAVRYRP
jgi:hypothetical protein